MSRNPLIFSIICILGLGVWGLITWFDLPEAAQYPIHWNAQGEADGFAGRNGVLAILVMMPLSLIFITALLYAIPLIEPLRKNFEESRAAYNGIWIGTVALLTLAGIMIIRMYHGENSADLTSTAIFSIGLGISLLFIWIGNVLGKVRQNFMLGIRTPWTLSSELSWEKTHRLGGKLFVGVGIIGVLLAFITPLKAILGVTALILIVTAISVIYSYKVWKDDPNKRS